MLRRLAAHLAPAGAADGADDDGAEVAVGAVPGVAHYTDPASGARTLIRTLVANDVTVCFSNPGTSEIHSVLIRAGSGCMQWEIDRLDTARLVCTPGTPGLYVSAACRAALRGLQRCCRRAPHTPPPSPGANVCAAGANGGHGLRVFSAGAGAERVSIDGLVGYVREGDAQAGLRDYPEP